MGVVIHVQLGHAHPLLLILSGQLFDDGRNHAKLCGSIKLKFILLRAYPNLVGNLEDGFAFVGTNACMVKEISTVEKVFNELQDENLA